MAEERVARDGAAERAALWDTWEQVEGRTLDEVREIYRGALRARGAEVRSEGGFFAFMTTAMVGGSWSGDEVRDGARKLHQRVTTDYRAARDRQVTTKPMREQIRREVADDAAGKTREQVRAELAASYAAHGLEPPSAPQLGAEAVKILRPSWRDGLLAVRDRRAFVESVLGLSYPVQSAPRQPPPAWSEPPAGRAHRRVGRQVAVRVELSDDGDEALSRLVAEWQPDAPDHQPVCWLTVGADPADPVAVHLGETTIGRLDAHASDLCRERVADAQAVKQWLHAASLLTSDGSTPSRFLLRVRIPLTSPDDNSD